MFFAYLLHGNPNAATCDGCEIFYYITNEKVEVRTELHTLIYTIMQSTTVYISTGSFKETWCTRVKGQAGKLRTTDNIKVARLKIHSRHFSGQKVPTKL
jgi:hypothetical protein